MKAALNRKQLLSHKPVVPHETVEVPELGGVVIVRGMTGKEQTALYKSARKGKGQEIDEELFGARLIIACLVDGQGNHLLEDGETDLVLSWPHSVGQRLAQAAMRVNGLGGDRGNLSATGGEDLSSD